MTTRSLDPELLRAFVEVAEQRSFTRAATMLNRTQSAVSMQIKRLENQLQVQLFRRTTVSVEMSSAGEGFLGYARRIIALNDEALGRVRQHRIEGVVRLGVMEDYGAYVIPALLSGFVAEYPMIHIEMATGLTCNMPERLGDAFDLVIAMHPTGLRQGQFLRREQPVWAGGPDYEVEACDPLPVALYPQGCLFRKWAMEALDTAKRPWRLAFVSQSQAAVESFVAQGLAVTVVKSGLFPKRLRRLTSKDNMPELPSADICLHRAINLSPAGTLLANHIAAALASTS
jgi:DNA-binding transcriptional LysR family regulator